MRSSFKKALSAVAIAAVLAGFGTVAVGTVVAAPASAATGSNFDPGNIIDDALFFNGSIMSEQAVQSFLEAKVPRCAQTVGNPGCLASYRADSVARPADRYCSAFDAGTAERASTIIYRVGKACNINPQVLLATLQKEQGLVLSTNPSPGRYKIAMGYGCPDTAPCDTMYYGLTNQLYSAARQFQSYRLNPLSFNYRPGRVNTVAWHPNAACGSSQVFIQQAATAALYNYTPYRPNAAALANISGTGDTCSAYGNRNFWAYFTDWFGSTTVSPQAAASVRAMYADVLGRSPSDGEVVGWGRQIMGGMPPIDVAYFFVNSDEYRLQRINAAYLGVLGRPAEPGGAEGWLNAMHQGYLQTDDVDKIFLASQEYLVRSGGTNETFVAALYLKLIGRPAGANEISGWAAVAAKQGRQSVVNAIWNSFETARSRVSIMYQTYLGRSPSPQELDSAATTAILAGDGAVRWALVGSAEYQARALVRFPPPAL